MIADLASGMTQKEAGEKHGVPVGTLGNWVAPSVCKRKQAAEARLVHEAVKNVQASIPESKHALFDEAFLRLAEASFTMLEEWAKACADPSFIRSNPLGAHVLGSTVIDRCDRIVAMLQARERGGRQ